MMSGSSEGSNGTLNNLLKYRFTKRPMPKLSYSDSQTTDPNDYASQNSDAVIGLSKANSAVSADSQATVTYDIQSASQEVVDSQASTVSPSYHRHSQDGPPSSPVFMSNPRENLGWGITISSVTSLADDGPFISSVASLNGGDAAGSSGGPEEDDTCASQGSSWSASSNEDSKEAKFKRLREMFPASTENKIRAALIVYPNDFQKAVEFMSSDLLKPGPKRDKRPSPDSDFDDLPEISGNYKRIKTCPRSPSPVNSSLEFQNESLSNESSATKITPDDFEKNLCFLRGYFPAKSVEHLRIALTTHNGNVKSVVAALSETKGEAKAEESLTKKQAGPSSTVASTPTPAKPVSALKPQVKPTKPVSALKPQVKPTKPVSALKPQVTSSKVKKKEVIDVSDEDEDYQQGYDSDDSDYSEDLGSKSKTETENYLQFFEEASIEELSAMPGCSKKKAELIMGLRPFKTWDNMIQAFNSERQLSASLISSCKEIMQIRNTIRRLMMRCESISQQMGLVVSRLTKQTGSSESDGKRITKQPDLLNKEFELQPYQLIGLSWLRIMHEQQLNGILADEMGLGKTIQAISFLAHLLEEGEEGPHVIIVPSSTIENWLRELQLWCPALKVVVYYGSPEERRAVRHSIFFQGEEFNILLTTYNMATGGVEDRVLFKKFQFHYAIFDEGHMLKNMSSLRFQNLMKIAADRRLLLTGTPLQNNLLELMSLLCFVMPEIFQGKTDHLKKVFAMISKSDEKQKSRFEKDRIAQAKRIMKPFVLRRLKRDVLQSLPPKTEHILKCTLIPGQQELYDRLVTKYSQEIGDSDESTSLGGVGIFMQFRKAANHPLLLRNLYTDDKLSAMANDIAKEPSHRERGALPALIQEDMAVMNDFELSALCKQYKKHLGKYVLDEAVVQDSGKFRKLDVLLPEMMEKNDRVLLFSQFTMMLDIMEIYLEQKGYKFLRMDGQTPVPDRLQLIDKFNNEPDIFVFLLSTRAGGLGINLAAANTIILHDIDFNPYNDKQAEDRCHRLGQKREVTVYKLICEDTVDEAMLKCANDKLALEKDLTGPEQDGESEENIKDVAHMLREALKLRQKKKEANTPQVLDSSQSSS